jgi:SPP1 gp7 family putative phage head morphogenesis protein
MATASRRRTERHVRQWLRIHATSERRLARAVAQFFRQQGARILARLRGHGTITPVDVSNAIDWHAENERFIRTVARPQLLSQMVTAASLGLLAFPHGKALRSLMQKAGEKKQPIMIPFDELPERVQSSILDTLDETLAQPYWAGIQLENQLSIEGAIRDALSDGIYGEGPLSKVIEEATDGEIPRNRAERIARTETGGALNAGHMAAMEELKQSGDVTGTQWLAIDDKDTRESHRELNGTVVAVGEDFEVGDVHAPYPGYFGLPPEERVNCRCTIIASGVEVEDRDAA